MKLISQMGIRSILVIEDDLAFASVLTAFFRRVLPNADVRHLDHLPTREACLSVDLILCDLHLPNTPAELVFSGLDYENLDAPVVFMSSDKKELKLLRAFFRGNYQLLSKDALFFGKLECLLLERTGAMA